MMACRWFLTLATLRLEVEFVGYVSAMVDDIKLGGGFVDHKRVRLPKYATVRCRLSVV